MIDNVKDWFIKLFKKDKKKFIASVNGIGVTYSAGIDASTSEYNMYLKAVGCVKNSSKVLYQACSKEEYDRIIPSLLDKTFEIREVKFI